MTTAPPNDDTLPEDDAAPTPEIGDDQPQDQGGEATPQARVAELEKKLAEANDRMLRALAEADNTRKRLEKERMDTAKFAVSSFARDLLSVADNLRRALAAITPSSARTTPS
jgi:molecular chaperone GrpE